MAKDTKKKSKGGGSGCLMLFGLPFAGAGLFVLYMALSAPLDAWRMADWAEVDCRVLSAELEEHRGDDSTTYEVKARYRYTFNGREYTAERVSVHTGGDNIGSFQQDTYQQLAEYERSGEPFRCYVNPSDPSEAVLFRDLRWGLVVMMFLFGMVFSSVGLGLIAFGVWGGRLAKQQSALAALHPDEPWLHRPDWGEGQIRSTSKMRLWVSLVFALFWNAVSSFVWFAIPEVLEDGEWWVAALMGLFPLVGLGMIAWAAYEVARWRKYGTSVFQMASVPGVLGGTLAGVIRIGRLIEPREGFKLTLNCIRRSTTGSGKHRSTHETVLWQDEQLIGRTLSAGEPNVTAVPVMFSVPYDQPASTVEDTNRDIIWRLEVKADVPGVDYGAAFEVPVFKTDESREDFQADTQAINEYAVEADPEVELRRLGIRRTLPPVGFGTRLIFPMGRNPGMLVGSFFFSAIFGGAIWLMLHLEAPLLFPIVFGLFALLIVWVTLELMLYRSTVDVDEHGLTVRGGWLGLGRSVRIARDEIEQITTRSNLQSGQRKYYDIIAQRTTGKKVVLAKYIRGTRQAETVIAEIRRAMGEPDR